MPTSKDILNQSKKDYENNAPVKKALDDTLDIGQKDIAEFVKAKHVLLVSINSMESMCRVLKSNIGELNKDLSELRKNEPVMKAPADAKVYEALVKAYTDAIRTSMEYYKDIDDKAKDAKGRL